MFDLLGVATVNNTRFATGELPSAGFAREPWTGDPAAKLVRREVDSLDCQAVGVSRADEPEGYAVSDDCHLFLVGDAFQRLDCHEPELSTGRLSAPELLRFYGRRGATFTEAIKGNFSIVIVDGRARQTHIVSSHFAVSPLYFASTQSVTYFSTSLSELGRSMPQRPELDEAAIVEAALLNWPLHERTFLRDVRRVAPGTMLTIGHDGGVARRTYWDMRQFYNRPALGLAEALEQSSELFHAIVNQLASDQQNVGASFTAGFDSRAVHAALDRDHSHVMSYAFGIAGSVNVSIPKAICATLGYPFDPIYLDGDYERAFADCARQTVMLSDGLVLQRANYPYVFRRLSAFSPVVLTGVFGSEFLRTFQNVGTSINDNFVRLNGAQNPLAELERLLAEHATQTYLSPEVQKAARDEVLTDFASWLAWSRDFSPNQRLHLFLMREASRKYFGAEVSTERLYAANRFPFLDVEFFEYASQAPFAGMRSRAVTPSVRERVDSQMFYAHLVRKYRPELLRFATDRGYSPGDLLRPLPVLRAGVKALLHRYRRDLLHYREFNTEEWLTQYYGQHLSPHTGHDAYLLGPAFAEDLRSGAWKSHAAEFHQVAALRTWLEGWH